MSSHGDHRPKEQRRKSLQQHRHERVQHGRLRRDQNLRLHQLEVHHGQRQPVLLLPGHRQRGVRLGQHRHEVHRQGQHHAELLHVEEAAEEDN